MQTHIMRFNSFQDKRIAVDWIKENLAPDDFNECLTELKIVFFTGVAPRVRTLDRMLIVVPHASYESHDY